ncbi:hypothetical protein O9X80_23245 [Agrobacterium salinitolerans]|uniref:hypothetical protein n=1 Tax=Agrobacterium salinitolerans TaxID=1183413 RepID=UPI0022B84A00|nr:hypothetical protein [Agrobacterium salinitolerans]MCZ7977420.1 hypothetical protein [Agrobacterium salinitolerans]
MLIARPLRLVSSGDQRAPLLFFKADHFGSLTRNDKMNLPVFWRQATFSVAESAEILSVPEDTLRTWMAREPSGEFLGARTGGRVFLSGNDLYFYSLLRDFSGFGVPIRPAMGAAAGIAEFSGTALPPEKFIIIRKRIGSTHFEQTDDVDVSDRPAAVIPLRRQAEVLIDRCTAICARRSD